MYGGASQWLGFKKAKSGSAEGASSDEQALFLAWMASMGRRQDSLFALEKDEKKKTAESDSGSDAAESFDSLVDGSEESSEAATSVSHDSDASPRSGRSPRSGGKAATRAAEK